MPAETVQIKNGCQLLCPGRAVPGHLVVHGETSGGKYLLENRNQPPETGDFVESVGDNPPLYRAASGAGTGVFSPGPGQSLLYANGKEACIWSGPEMRVAAFFSLKEVSVSLTDLTFAANAAPTRDTITSAATDFYAAGFRPGQKIRISGTGSNNITATITKLEDATGTKNRIHVLEDSITAEGPGASAVIEAVPGFNGNQSPIDLSDAVNNDLATAGNTAHVGGGGNDAETVFLAHCEGTAGTSTPLTDSSASGHTATAAGTAAFSGSLSRFGSTCLEFSGSGDYVTIPDHADWDFGTGLFAVEAWAAFKSTSPALLFGQWQDTNNYWALWYTGSKLLVEMKSTGVTYLSISGPAWTPEPGRFYHLAFNRGWAGVSNRFSLAVDGVQQNYQDLSTLMPNYAGPFCLGGYSGYANGLDGYLDEVRVSKGKARWTADFTPPTLAYSEARNLLALLTTRPIQAWRGYLAEANATGGTALAGRVWTGQDFTDVDVEDRSQGLSISAADEAPPEDQSSLLVNGDFAWGTDSWDRLQGNETLAQDSGGLSGDCLKITGGASANPGATQAVAVTAGQSYFFRCAVKAGDEATYRVQFWDDTNGAEIDVTGDAEAAADWTTRCRRTVTAPAGCSSIEVRLIQVAGAAAGTYLYFDEAHFGPCTPGEVWTGSTVATAKPLLFEGVCLYAYLFTLAEGEATIRRITVDCPFQPMTDVWDGVFRQATRCQVNTGSAKKDYTLEINEPSDENLPLVADLSSLSTSGEITLIFESRVSALFVSMLTGSVNANAATPVVSTHGALGFNQVSGLRDGTIGDEYDWKTLSQTGYIAWAPPLREEEQPMTLNGETGYAVKIQFDAALSATVKVDTIYGVPAQELPRPADAVSRYQDMVLLVGYSEGGEGNRVDYSMPGAPDVMNGELSSMGGLQALYFGGAETLIAGVELYNRFGSNVYTFWLGFKGSSVHMLHGTGPEDFRLFPISYEVGLASAKALAVIPMGYEMAQGIERNVAMWISFVGVMLFDGAVMQRISGIENYFDRTKSECVNFDALDTSDLWYDAEHHEINVLLPSGSGQAAPNVWLVYNLVKKAWFQKDPGSGNVPACGFPVKSPNGTPYCYAGTAAGRLLRLENGPDWDGDAIAWELQTGDFSLTKSPYDITLLKHVKVVAHRISESSALTLAHCPDTGSAFKTLAQFDLSTGTGRLVRHNARVNEKGWVHRLKLSGSTQASEPGAWLEALALQYEETERKDE